MSAERDTFAPVPPNGISRQATVRPSMCGHNSLFLGQIGDWTWDAVSELCGTDTLRARTEEGNPTYLAFFYYHLQASAQFHLGNVAFGDRLQIESRLFGFGSESILTLHRIARNGAPPSAGSFPCEELYERPQPGCIYVENFNRWVMRTEPGRNAGLTSASPVGFDDRHLPRLPEAFSPRATYNHARLHQTFRRDEQLAAPSLAEHDLSYPVDLTRDLNGVGLMYFASYFSIVDQAIWQLWRRLDRSDRSFLGRVVHDYKICYLGNGDADTVIGVKAAAFKAPAGRELFDVSLRDRASGRLLALASLLISRGETS